MKNFIRPSFALKIVCLAIFCLGFINTAKSQTRESNTFRSGVGFAYIVEGDNSGALFSNQLSHTFTNRVHGALSVEYLSSSRYEKASQLFTSRKAFIMIDAALLVDILQKPVTTIRIGAGPAVRRRSELDLEQGATGPNTSPGQRGTEAFVHKRSRDLGAKFTIENEFYRDNRMSYGWRASTYFYNAGTSIFNAGLYLGFSF